MLDFELCRVVKMSLLYGHEMFEGIASISLVKKWIEVLFRHRANFLVHVWNLNQKSEVKAMFEGTFDHPKGTIGGDNFLL